MFRSKLKFLFYFTVHVPAVGQCQVVKTVQLHEELQEQSRYYFESAPNALFESKAVKAPNIYVMQKMIRQQFYAFWARLAI